MRTPTVRRPSLPLTQRDELDLARLRAPGYLNALERLVAPATDLADASEAVLLHAIFQAGVNAVQEAVADAGYAALADQLADEADDRRLAARRRQPGWSDEQ